MKSRPDPIDAVGVHIPYHFRCPISLELMSDPVTVSTGQTYDRSSIESWISTGNTSCPVTRSPLSSPSLIPNHTLRRLIQSWCVSHRSSGVSRIPTPKQPADLPLLSSLLSSLPSSLPRLLRLSSDSPSNLSLLSSLPSSRPLLLNLLFSHPDSIPQSLSLLSLLQLTDFDFDPDPDQVSFFVQLMSDENRFDVRINAASIIESVARSPQSRSTISGSAGVFEGVVGVIRAGGVKVGVRALFALCLNKQDRWKAVEAGAVEVLIDVLSSEVEKGEAERAAATVELLCRVPKGCEAFAGNLMTAEVLVRMMLKVSERATEYAAGALLAVCEASERVKREAVAAGMITQLLLLVQSDCTERAKRKAQLLLKISRDSWPDDSVAVSDDFYCSDVVPY